MSVDTFVEQPIPANELHAALAAAHWDLYKEANGIRPRWYCYGEVSTSDLERAVLCLQEQIRELAEEQACLDAQWTAELRERAELVAQEAVKCLEERWMDQASATGATGW